MESEMFSMAMAKSDADIIRKNQDCVLRRLPLDPYLLQGMSDNHDEPVPVALYVNMANIENGNELISKPHFESSSLPQYSIGNEGNDDQTSSSGFVSYQSCQEDLGDDMNGDAKKYPKPVFSYKFLIVLAMKNSNDGTCAVQELYDFICEHFPFFRTASPGWKSTLRHYLTSKHRLFVKVDKPKVKRSIDYRGGFWALNPEKMDVIESVCTEWSKQPPGILLECMAHPEHFGTLMTGYDSPGLSWKPVSSKLGKKTTDNKSNNSNAPMKRKHSRVSKDSKSILERTLLEKVKLPSGHSSSSSQS